MSSRQARQARTTTRDRRATRRRRGTTRRRRGRQPHRRLRHCHATHTASIPHTPPRHNRPHRHGSHAHQTRHRRPLAPPPCMHLSQTARAAHPPMSTTRRTVWSRGPCDKTATAAHHINNNPFSRKEPAAHARTPRRSNRFRASAVPHPHCWTRNTPHPPAPHLRVRTPPAPPHNPSSPPKPRPEPAGQEFSSDPTPRARPTDLATRGLRAHPAKHLTWLACRTRANLRTVAGWRS